MYYCFEQHQKEAQIVCPFDAVQIWSENQTVVNKTNIVEDNLQGLHTRSYFKHLGLLTEVVTAHDDPIDVSERRSNYPELALALA